MPLGEKRKSILILCPYPFNGAPGQRFRYEQYLSKLDDAGIKYTIKSFLSTSVNAILYKEGNSFRKMRGVLFGYIKRVGHLIYALKFDYIFVFREVSPLGPPVFEWVLAKVLRKRIIYDFDDAIWVPFKSISNSLTNHLKWTQKVASICSWSYKVSVGNDYLANYASKFNERTEVIPTIVDTENRHNRKVNHQKQKVNIGWTGSHSTLRYLDEIVPILSELEQKYDFTFIVIADKNPSLPLKSFKFIKWNEASEIEDLLEFHIGLMPLPDDEWAKGKCGFKAIQYMALEIPALVSPVGVNTKIVEHGKTGFHCKSDSDWKINIESLLTDSSLREQMGKMARQEIENSYSVKSTTNQFLALFT